MPCNTEREWRSVDIRDWRVKGVPLAEQVDKFECPEIEAYYRRELGLSDLDAAELFADVKKFVYAASLCHEACAPTEKIDAGWHGFILHTPDYGMFCDMIGRFVHHVPRPEPHPRDAEARRRARDKAQELFGPLGHNWDLGESRVAA